MKKIGIGLCLYFFGTSLAFAYLEPVTGSIILQGAIGTIVTGLYFVRLYWYKLKVFWCKLLGLAPPEKFEAYTDLKNEE